MSIKTYTPAQAIQAASVEGSIEIQEGVYLSSKENMLAEQEGWGDQDLAKNVDFGSAPFWIHTNDGYVSPIESADEEELAEILADQDEDFDNFQVAQDMADDGSLDLSDAGDRRCYDQMQGRY